MARLTSLPPRLALAEIRRLVPMTVDDQRGSGAARGYDAAWRRLRLRILAEEPLCRFCSLAGRTVAAVEVDHVEPIAEAPHLRLEPTNLRPLCTPCHSARTQRHRAARRRGF